MKKNKLSFKKIYDEIINTWNKIIEFKYINFIFKFLPRNFFIFILFIMSIFVLSHIYKINNYDYLYYQGHTDAITNTLLEGPLEIPLNNIELKGTPNKMCFRFATFQRKNKSNITISLYKDNELKENTSFSATKLKDKELYCVSIKEDLNNDNIKEYNIKIESSKTNAYNTIALHKNKDTGEPAIYFVRDSSIFNIRNIIILIYIIIFIILNYYINKKNIKPEILYLIISPCYLLFIMFLIPPYQIPDEQTHFINTINLSQIGEDDNISKHFENKEITVPDNLKCITYSNPQKSDKVYDFNQLKECFNEGEDITKKDNHVNSRYKLSYIFTVIGYKIADIFSNSPIVLFYAGRLCNFLAAIIMIFFAIKIAPKYKEILLSIATIPMFIQQMVSYSYDSVLNALVLLVISVILNLIYNNKANKILMYIILFLSSIIIANIKYLYLYVYLLLLYIPDKKDKKKYLKIIYSFGIILIAYIIGMKVISFKSVSTPTVTHTIKNLDYIMRNPMMIFSIAYHTFRINTLFYIRGLIGYFGWFIYKIPNIYIIAYFFYFLYLIFSNENIKAKKIYKIINILAILIAFSAIFAAMYFWYSESKLYYVDGVQGRYFISLLMPIFLLLMPKKQIIKNDLKINYSFINLILFSFTIMLLMWYY